MNKPAAKVNRPGFDIPGPGGGGGSAPGAAPAIGPSVPAAPGATGDATGLQGDYTAPDALDGHRHAVLATNFNEETGNGITEIEGGFGTSMPAHAHAIVAWFVEPYRQGAFESIHGSFGVPN